MKSQVCSQRDTNRSRYSGIYTVK